MGREKFKASALVGAEPAHQISALADVVQEHDSDLTRLRAADAAMRIDMRALTAGLTRIEVGLATNRRWSVMLVGFIVAAILWSGRR